jgi:hypothetical protein
MDNLPLVTSKIILDKKNIQNFNNQKQKNTRSKSAA